MRERQAGQPVESASRSLDVQIKEALPAIAHQLLYAQVLECAQQLGAMRLHHELRPGGTAA